MGKVLKITGIFILVLSIALSGIFITCCFAPGFREDTEKFLGIKDKNAISTLKGEISKRDEQIKNYESRIETLKLKISDLELTVEELGIEDEFLRSEIQRLQARVKELENQVENLDGTIDDLNSQIEEMNKEVDALWNIYTNLGEYDNSVNNGTSADTQLTESEKALLEEKIEELEETVEELTEEIKELNETIEDLEKQIENLENEKQEVEELKVINANLIIDKSKSIDEYNYDIEKYNYDIQNIDKSINNNYIVIQELEAKQKDGTITEDEAKELVNLSNANKDLEMQKYDINANLTECENKVAELQAEVTQLEKNKIEYSNRLENINTQITTLQNQVLELESEASGVQSNIDSLQAKINKFNGLIGNSTIINGNGEVISKPTNPVNPENPEEPKDPETPVDPPVSDLEVTINGKAYFDKLDYTKMQDIDSLEKYLTNNGYTFVLTPEEELDAETLEVFKGAITFVMASYEGEENPLFGAVIYNDTELANGIFDAAIFMQETYGKEAVVNCVVKCGVLGLFEVEFLPCEHTETYIARENEQETDTQISYYLVTRCVNCGNAINTEFIVEPKDCKHENTSQSQENYKENGDSYSYDLVTRCNDCNEEISREYIEKQKEHICEPAQVVIENEVRTPTHISYDEVTYCSCGKEISRNHIEEENICKHFNCSQIVNTTEDDNYIYTEYINYCDDCGAEVSRFTDTQEKETSQEFNVYSQDEFYNALDNANDGDTINLNGTINLNEPLLIDKNLTINGGEITGAPVYVTANNVTLSYVIFIDLINENEIQESYIYAQNYGGSLIIEGCTFFGVEYEAIQITPVEGANIVIKDCVFEVDNAGQQRYIHIEGNKDKIVDCNIKILSNEFNNLEMLDTTNNNGEAVGVYYVNLKNVTFEMNTLSGELTMEELQAKIKISNKAPWTTDSKIFDYNSFSPLV
ncbi:MAG: hypothetical protein IJX17_06545 [Clostridia bacterium]|nr:hypothetical protein [Clostridia bacterium]